MYLPSYENRTSEIEDMISEKNDLDDGSSSCSNTVYHAVSLEGGRGRLGVHGGGKTYASHVGRRGHSVAYLQA